MTAKIHGRLGANDLAATTLTSVYAVPAGRKATVIVSLCNRTSGDITVRLAHCPGAIGSVANADYLEYGITLAANGGVIERDRITMAAAASIGAYASAVGVSVSVRGVEEDI